MGGVSLPYPNGGDPGAFPDKTDIFNENLVSSGLYGSQKLNHQSNHL